MPDWINAVFLLIGGIGGLTGIAALWNAKTAARKADLDAVAAAGKADLDALTKIVETLQTENERLVERVIMLEEQNKTLREENKTLRQRVRVLENVISKHDIALDDGG